MQLRKRKERVKTDTNKITEYVEPIYRFCRKRLSDSYDAEDLASDIIYHILDGMNKYNIKSFDAWVWRIAHNRYARFIDQRNKNRMILSCEDELFEIADTPIEEGDNRYDSVFRCLHTLSSEYRNIFADHYVRELSVKELSEKYSLPETTVKWRLNVGRQKIRDRIGDEKMDKVYERINWNTTICNGNMDSHTYLRTQIARAICLAAYEKPVTVEEISLKTGIPAMYIEDELPRLECGDAIIRNGNKYSTNFIIFSLDNRRSLSEISETAVLTVADKMQSELKNAEDRIKQLDFYGNDFGVERLGHMVVPYLMRRAGREAKKRLELENGPFPPRTDGGYGWYIIEETENEREDVHRYSAGCNLAMDDSVPISVYYYWIGKYFDNGIYHGHGTRYMCESGIIRNAVHGELKAELVSEEDVAELKKVNLLIGSGERYFLNFPCFEKAQFEKFISLFDMDDEIINRVFEDWIMKLLRGFEQFVPKRLHSQINQWIGYYAMQSVGLVVDELIKRGVLVKPCEDIPFVCGVFSVQGDINRINM
ncbi:MAG: sigma-70 family RNA polymerase sigma factor [Clostridia bacterium]|nr:sigma-70 family RNA polymerase sigma factor [Clostridia bacterium]